MSTLPTIKNYKHQPSALDALAVNILNKLRDEVAYIKRQKRIKNSK